MPDKIDCCQKVIDGVDYEDVIELKYADGVSKLYSSFTGLKSFTGVVRGSAGKIIIPNFSRPVKAVLYSNDGKKEILRGKKGYVYEFDACAAGAYGQQHYETAKHDKRLKDSRRMQAAKRINISGRGRTSIERV